MHSVSLNILFCLFLQTKKVPLQMNKPSPAIADFKDFNLLTPHKDGPTLVKSPPKLRPSSPVNTNMVTMPRNLPPLNRRPLDKPPAYTPRDIPLGNPTEPPSVGPTGPGDNEAYPVNNREFNGRAYDPGQMLSVFLFQSI